MHTASGWLRQCWPACHVSRPLSWPSRAAAAGGSYPTTPITRAAAHTPAPARQPPHCPRHHAAAAGSHAVRGRAREVLRGAGAACPHPAPAQQPQRAHPLGRQPGHSGHRRSRVHALRRCAGEATAHAHGAEAVAQAARSTATAVGAQGHAHGGRAGATAASAQDRGAAPAGRSCRSGSWHCRWCIRAAAAARAGRGGLTCGRASGWWGTAGWSACWLRARVCSRGCCCWHRVNAAAHARQAGPDAMQQRRCS